jgi:hypothetical protein
MKSLSVKKGTRYFDINGTVYVIIYSKRDVIKLIPIKPDAMVDVWELEEFKKQVSSLKFTHVPHPPINRLNVSEHLLEFQFNILGKTMINTIDEIDWKNEWRLNSKQKILFKSYAIGLLKKVFRFNASKARETYEFFNTKFGLQTFD